MSDNIGGANFFYDKLRTGYREMWHHLLEKGIASIEISPESTFQDFFRSRIEPINRHDKRDLVWFSFHDFPFILQYSFKVDDIDNPPPDLDELASFWISNYRGILDTIPLERAEVIHNTAEQLIRELPMTKAS